MTHFDKSSSECIYVFSEMNVKMRHAAQLTFYLQQNPAWHTKETILGLNHPQEASIWSILE